MTPTITYPPMPFQPVAPISNGSDNTSLNVLSDVPQLTDSVLAYFQAMDLVRVIKKNIEGRLQEVRIPIATRGFLQVFKQALKVRTDGQRLWKKKNLFLLPGPTLEPDDIVYIQDVSYRVMLVSDYSQNGYMRYGLVETYARRLE